MIDLLFECFKNQSSSSSSSPTQTREDLKFQILLLYDQPGKVLFNGDKLNTAEDQFQLVADIDLINEKLFYDTKLISCRCLPLLINILHMALPDKRQIDVNHVLDKLVNALEEEVDAHVKYELVKAYLSLLEECGDKAAMKIVLVTSKFILCLLEQLRLVSAESGKENSDFVKEFVYISLSLFKSLLDRSQSVKDIFRDCHGYELLHQVLKTIDVISIEISILINEMVNKT